MRSFSTRTAGLLILILGAWGGLVPFIGHYFNFAMGPDKAWAWTSGRGWLSVLPGGVAVLGGLILMGAGPRLSGKVGALMALAAGIWFAVGPDVSLLWNSAGAQGVAHGSKTVRVLEMLAYHTALGSVMAALAGYALPGFIRRRAVAAEPAAADRTAAAEPVAARRTAPAAAATPVAAERAAPATERTAPAAAPRAAERTAPAAPAPAATEPTRAAEPTTRTEPTTATESTTAAQPTTAAEPTTRTESTTAAQPTTAAEPTTAQGATAADPAGDDTHTVRRRRGGLLSVLTRR